MKISYEHIKLSDFKHLNNFDVICDGDKREVRLIPNPTRLEDIIEFVVLDYYEGD